MNKRSFGNNLHNRSAIARKRANPTSQCLIVSHRMASENLKSPDRYPDFIEAATTRLADYRQIRRFDLAKPTGICMCLTGKEYDFSLNLLRDEFINKANNIRGSHGTNRHPFQ